MHPARTPKRVAVHYFGGGGGKVQGWTEDRMTDTTTLNINIPSLASKTSRRDNLAFLAHNNNSPSHQVPHQNQVYT